MGIGGGGGEGAVQAAIMLRLSTGNEVLFDVLTCVTFALMMLGLRQQSQCKTQRLI